MFYRVAIRVETSSTWQWKSTALEGLSAVFQLLRVYRPIPQDRLRVFTGASREELSEQLQQENGGLGSRSVTAGEFLKAQMIHTPADTGGADQARASSAPRTVPAHSLAPAPFANGAVGLWEKRRQELEAGAGGDHDQPYSLWLPSSTPQLLAWFRLLAKVKRGELPS